MFRRRTALLAVLCSLSATASLGQINSGEISGVVRDASGGVLPAATVTATHVATGIVVERVQTTKAVFSCRRCASEFGMSRRGSQDSSSQTTRSFWK